MSFEASSVDFPACEFYCDEALTVPHVASNTSQNRYLLCRYDIDSGPQCL